MSEKNYDSDAQHLSTPQQSPTRPSATANNNQGLQHSERNNHEERLRVLSEQSHEFEDSNGWDLSRENGKWQYGSLRDRLATVPLMPNSHVPDLPTSNSLAERMDTSQPVGYQIPEVTGELALPSQSQQALFLAHETEPSRLTSLSNDSSEVNSERSLALSQQTQVLNIGPMSIDARLVSTSSNSSDEHMSEIVVRKRRQQVQHTNSKPTSIDERLASTGSSNMPEIVVRRRRQEVQHTDSNPTSIDERLSSAGSSNMPQIVVGKRGQETQHTDPEPTSVDERLASTSSSNTSDERMSEIVVEKKRRRPSPEVRSIHLYDLNIPKVLAPTPSITPRSQSRAFEEDGQGSIPSSRHVSGQSESSLWWDRADNSFLAPERPFRNMNASSNYSRRSISSADFSVNFMTPKPRRFSSINYRPNNSGEGCLDSALSVDQLVPSTSNLYLGDRDGTKPVKEYRRSRFTENFDIEGLSSLDGQPPYGESVGGMVPRKVSVGWMSAGRRLGYGYATIDSSQDETTPALSNDYDSLPGSEQEHNSGCSTVEYGSREHIERQPTVQETSPRSGNTSASVNQVHFPRRRWPGATNVLRPVKSEGSMESASTLRSLWSKLTGRTRKNKIAQARTSEDTSVADQKSRTSSDSPSIIVKDRRVKAFPVFGGPKKHRKSRAETRHSNGFRRFKRHSTSEVETSRESAFLEI